MMVRDESRILQGVFEEEFGMASRIGRLSICVQGQWSNHARHFRHEQMQHSGLEFGDLR